MSHEQVTINGGMSLTPSVGPKWPGGTYNKKWWYVGTIDGLFSEVHLQLPSINILSILYGNRLNITSLSEGVIRDALRELHLPHILSSFFM